VCNPSAGVTAVMLCDEDSFVWPRELQGKDEMDDPWEAPPMSHFGIGLHVDLSVDGNWFIFVRLGICAILSDSVLDLLLALFIKDPVVFQSSPAVTD
jgi:hypothetical protein